MIMAWMLAYNYRDNKIVKIFDILHFQKKPANIIVKMREVVLLHICLLHTIYQVLLQVSTDSAVTSAKGAILM